MRKLTSYEDKRSFVATVNIQEKASRAPFVEIRVSVYHPCLSVARLNAS